MRSMYETMVAVYSGLKMIDDSINVKDNKPSIPLNNIAIAPQYVTNSIMHTVNVHNFADSISYSTLINVGQENEPIFILVVDNQEWESICDIAAGAITKLPIPIIMISSRIFSPQNTSPYECALELYCTFKSLLSFDPYIGVEPSIDALNAAASCPSGQYCSSYDYTMMLAAMYMINKLILYWYEPNNVKILHGDVARMMRDENATDDTIKNVNAVCKGATGDFDDMIKNGMYIKLLFE